MTDTELIVQAIESLKLLMGIGIAFVLLFMVISIIAIGVTTIDTIKAIDRLRRHIKP